MNPSRSVVIEHKCKKYIPIKRDSCKQYYNAKWNWDDVVKEAVTLKEKRKRFLKINHTKIWDN